MKLGVIVFLWIFSMMAIEIHTPLKQGSLKLSCLQGQKSSKSSEEEGSNFLTLSNSNIR